MLPQCQTWHQQALFGTLVSSQVVVCTAGVDVRLDAREMGTENKAAGVSVTLKHCCSPDGSLSDIGEVETKAGESQLKASRSWSNCWVGRGELETEEEKVTGELWLRVPN